ncbi:UDP-4-amino-4,6-dideoxy-N-acetyl-beta-L-altrosamine transaminase [Pseudomonas oryzihabitans]|uniref:UDP-4-amino-4, 6-dideoxy-N-acetyl-beta-L-altrosamine transaminase n=1 Tax=Pseudomonas oryzihabitans TaxID=47885 RepID=A0AAJ2BN23_9PSED|nr:UDP-4-amino-4,6-dideoxy-N-acetyl-beta-L-altrosamine transaminase [Pseudomonas psychrotolerans]MDR6236060.1 UDP-4-amino-4,6-dideoxy-N-acetyl-beta-L-altrosamine transaminase [Pseudomonas psychrotolerans]MDR6354625.1 UDP-4-amino-4,6-dideoxy-N-acetyl-beta-L-altrosamine transaminase [Pseudomonas psychrotolerans]
MSFIPYGRQSISEEDIAAVTAVLRSDWLTQGPMIERFEQAVAQRCEASYGVAVCNATAALHIACLALDLGPGDLLWTSPNTFVASANCARYCGADVDFVDIDPLTLSLSITALAAKLERAERAGRLPKILVPVAFAGQSCDMGAIQALARRYGFKVIEDASHAIGARYAGRPVGCGAYADITVFSFHPVKIVTTGEGGLLTTNDAALAERLRRLRSHGITRDLALMHEPGQGAWYYEQLELGFNYRMTDIQAALGVSQLERLEPFIARRRALIGRYRDLLAPLPVGLVGDQAQAQSAWHLFPIRLDEIQRDRVFAGLRAAGIGVNLHYIPVHLQPYYRALGFAPGDFPEAERYYAQALSLPLYAELSDAQQERVVQLLASLLDEEKP